MKHAQGLRFRFFLGIGLATLVFGGSRVRGQDQMPLKLDLPKARFEGTQKNIPPNPHIEPYTTQLRPDILVPKDTVKLSAGKPITSSDEMPVIGDLEMVTDGDKEGGDGSFVELGPGLQWVEIDLGKSCDIRAIVVWHFHKDARVYRDVVVQVSDDKDFITGIKTVYNNDYDNSSGLGVGQDKEYVDTNQGRLIQPTQTQGRYVRLYSNGSTGGDMNHYVEVEVYGK